MWSKTFRNAKIKSWIFEFSNHFMWRNIVTNVYKKQKNCVFAINVNYRMTLMKRSSWNFHLSHFLWCSCLKNINAWVICSRKIKWLIMTYCDRVKLNCVEFKIEMSSNLKSIWSNCDRVKLNDVFQTIVSN